jgi:hypothetical protein
MIEIVVHEGGVEGILEWYEEERLFVEGVEENIDGVEHFLARPLQELPRHSTKFNRRLADSSLPTTRFFKSFSLFLEHRKTIDPFLTC